MDNQPLVTISIPTYNSEKFIKLCLEAIKNQTYKNIEVNFIDGNSKDKTIEIIKSLGYENIITNNLSLLASRYEGAKAAGGEYVLMLDSDQILDADAIEKCIAKLKEDFDMLILGETVYSDKKFLEKLFKCDRDLINSVRDLSPFTGVLLPRFYKKSLLLKAFEAIPQNILEKVGGQDHAIIYYEAWSISKKVGYTEQCVRHIEPSELIPMMKKFYRWGKTSTGARFGKYDELLNKKEHFRTGLFKKGLITASLGSILLLVIKGVPYKLGYYINRFQNR
jgi:glycosyltransferase involved in cell wall biosynthesis